MASPNREPLTSVLGSFFWLFLGVVKVRKCGCFPLTHHLGGDFDHGKIMRPVVGVPASVSHKNGSINKGQSFGKFQHCFSHRACCCWISEHILYLRLHAIQNLNLPCIRYIVPGSRRLFKAHVAKAWRNPFNFCFCPYAAHGNVCDLSAKAASCKHSSTGPASHREHRNNTTKHQTRVHESSMVAHIYIYIYICIYSLHAYVAIICTCKHTSKNIVAAKLLPSWPELVL